MKKGFIAAVCAAIVAAVSCVSTDDLYQKVGDLDKRVTALEEKVKELNEKTIPGLQTTVAALQGAVTIEKITKTATGWDIKFSDGTSATLRDGIDGEDGAKGDKGDTPVIGAKEVEGVFYWTADGELMLDENGKPIPVHAALPQLRIKDGKWEVSYDEGATWAVVPTLGEAGQAISIVDSETKVTFIINGVSYDIQKELPFYMTFAQRENIGVPQGETYMFEYTLTGAQASDVIEVDVLSVTSGWEAKIVGATNEGGYVAVTNVDNSAGKVFVYATNGKGKSDIKSLKFEEGELTAVCDAEPVVPAGGEISLTVTTNMEYEVSIDEDAEDWLSIVPVTKATHTDVVTLNAEENTTGTFRDGVVYITNPQSGETLQSFTIIQYPSESVATDLSSLDKVADDATVTVYGVTVLATGKKAAVISDGEVNVYVTGKLLPVGKVINLTGVKGTNGNENPVLAATDYTVVEESSEVTAGDPTYYGYAPYYAPLYTTVTGPLSIVEGAYVVTAFEGQQVTVLDPIDMVSLDDYKEGDILNITGFVAETDGDNYSMVATAASKMTLKQNSAWTLSYSVDPEDASYPEVITNTVSGTTVRYTLGYVAKSEVESIEEAMTDIIIKSVDDIQYYCVYYQSYGYTWQQLFDLFVHTPETGSDSFKSFDYDVYYAYAVGIDALGRPTGDYAVAEFEKKDPHVPAEYSDYLGKWVFNGSNIEIAEKVNGESYTISGLANSVSGDVKTVEARYDAEAKNMYVMEQVLGQRTIAAYGVCHDFLSAMFTYGSSAYPAYPTNTEEPQVAFRAKMCEDGTVDFVGGTVIVDDEELAVPSYRLRWIIDEGDYAGRGNTYITVSLPQNLQKSKEASEDYKKWLGSYTVTNAVIGNPAEAFTGTITLAEGIADETILVNGLGIDGLPLQFNAETKNLELVFGTFGGNSTYTWYAAGITNDGYVAVGNSETGLLANFDMAADGTISIVSNPWYISDERPEVYAVKFGILGKNLSTGGWSTFRDLAYFQSPGTLVKAAAPTAMNVSQEACSELSSETGVVKFESKKPVKTLPNIGKAVKRELR